MRKPHDAWISQDRQCGNEVLPTQDVDLGSRIMGFWILDQIAGEYHAYFRQPTSGIS